MGSWPEDVGILGIHMVVPSTFVDQKEYEAFHGVPAGKYTIGLGQDKMGFCTDREDIHSLCMTALNGLVRKMGISYADIGRLDVGTETIVDKSKSVKSVLMKLFEESGNHDVEGLDTTNACYGGTAALFNAISWVESSAWDGRLAVVIAGDIAVYAEGSARPTGGAGAVAMLIGPNAPLVMERGLRASYMAHAYDFYKPNLSSEYPAVDGKLSIQCYLGALDSCYQTYCRKARKLSALTGDSSNDAVGINSFDAMVFHSPYGKLVEKSFARLVLNDFLSTPLERVPEVYPNLEKFAGVKLEETYFDRDVEKGFMSFSKQLFCRKTMPSLLLSNQVGNMYTASLYGGLVSYLISKPVDELGGKRVGFFSYGSGLASTMFSMKLVSGPKLAQLVSQLTYVHDSLARRTKVDPADYTAMMAAKEASYNKAPFLPTASTDSLFPGTFYLNEVDQMYRRTYGQVEEQ
ncbi:unnamed protein product [Nesidiocoris tenuis]|uniref:Hydroxymethylglutaryl-CoA synthase n=2 Tax=Nesidiocoris tenuis TaxID=355587 RepID=A0A6H5GEW1_9HEMI|nr:synthase [Nesidiocoris tenuis]CAB0001916.1 unnamed protein product [Nesidiocoris tenuis]